jgi:hypothetical protein
MPKAMRRCSSSLVRGVLVALTLGGIGLVAASASTACIPDPKGDYDDFTKRTEGLGGKDDVVIDAAVIDAKPPEEKTTALYVGVCVTTLASKDPNQALRFYTESTYTPDAPGAATGKLTFVLTPMVGYSLATNSPITPASVSRSETRGAAIPVAEFPVAANGRFTATIGTVNLTKESNSISGRDAIIENAILDGVYGAGDRFCSTLGGLLTSPYSFTFDPKQNTCLFQKVAADGAPMPTFTASEFGCTLPQ